MKEGKEPMNYQLLPPFYHSSDLKALLILSKSRPYSLDPYGSVYLGSADGVTAVRLGVYCTGDFCPLVDSFASNMAASRSPFSIL